MLSFPKRLSLVATRIVFTGLFLSVLLSGLGHSVHAQTVTTTIEGVTAMEASASQTTPVSGGVEGDQPARDGYYERGIIEGIVLRAKVTDTGAQQAEVYQVHFLSGLYKGETREISSDVGSNPYGLKPRTGDKVVVFIQPVPGADTAFYIEGYDRRIAIFWLVILFVLTLVLLAGWQGVKIAFSIFVSLLLIGYVLIPAFSHGVNPVPLAILLGGIFTLLSSGLSIGWNRKTYVTAVGTMGGALIAYLISLVFADWAHLNGLSSEEDRLFFDKNPTLNSRGLLFAGIIIASIGVVEDVAVSIASGVSEVKRANPRMAFRELFQAGMTIGNDHMGALANTLVYAYVGGSLSTLLLYQQFGGSWLKFVNFDSVVDEIIRSLAGTIGLVFTVPITALLSAWVMQKRQILQEVQRLHGHHLQVHSDKEEQQEEKK